MITFECDNCGHQQLVQPELAGRKVQCPKCGQVSQVPGAPIDGGQASAPRNAGTSSEITKFRCPKCDQKLGVKAKPGQPIRCTKCNAVVKVPHAVTEAGVQQDPSKFSLMDLAELEGKSPEIPPLPNKWKRDSSSAPPRDRQPGGAGGVFDVAPILMEDCPFCGEEILASASKCKHCGADLAAGHLEATPKPASPSFSSSFVPKEDSRFAYYLSLMPKWATMLLIVYALCDVVN